MSKGSGSQTSTTTSAPPSTIAPLLQGAAQAATDRYNAGSYIAPIQQTGIDYGQKVLNGDFLNANPYLDRHSRTLQVPLRTPCSRISRWLGEILAEWTQLLTLNMEPLELVADMTTSQPKSTAETTKRSVRDSRTF